MTAPTRRFSGFSLFLAALAFAATASAVDPPHSEDCGACHSTHGASYPSLLSQLCEGCHFPGGPAPAVQTHSSLATGDGYGNWHLDCWGCHDAHKQYQDRTWGTTYGMFLDVYLRAGIKEIDPSGPGPYYPAIAWLRLVSSSNVEHTSPTGFVDGDAEASDDICQVCHESTAYYDTDVNFNYHPDYGPDSQPGGDCVQCHPHDRGFAPQSCTGCHSQAQGSPTLYRRQIVGAGADFDRASHHVTDGSANEIVTDEDCVVCHDQSNHRSHAEPDVLLNDPDGGASLSYNGGGASIENFCVGCHDADSSLAFDSDQDNSDGYQPFNDNRTPQDIATRWAGAAHNAATPAALGDEACMACHGGIDGTRSGANFDGNAHGSDHGTLLSELVNGVMVGSTEEELCYACHDGFTALTDIASEFAGTATYTASSGALVNSHHDVSDADQTYSGAVIECVHCHDPHAANASNRLLGDPDTDDGVVPVAGLSWAGSTFLSEWCLDCHDGSYPATITPPTNALTNIAADYLDTRGDQHGLDDASRNVALRAGSGYQRGDILECAYCHNPGHGDDASGTVYPNLFNLKSVIYSKDGSTPLTPDTSWDPGNPNVVRITNTSSGNTDGNTNGKAWCSSCHPDPMGGNKSSGCVGGNCHNHGTGSF